MKLIFKGTKVEYDKFMANIRHCPGDMGLDRPESPAYCLNHDSCVECWEHFIEFEEEKEIKGMKELTTVMTLGITAIERGTDERINELIESERARVNFDSLRSFLMAKYGWDDVSLVDIKHFVRDIQEEREEPDMYLTTGGIEIDYDKLADKVLDRLIERCGGLPETKATEVFFEDNMEG